jgi:hypothetical protein
MMIATVLGTASRELEEVEMAFPFSEEARSRRDQTSMISSSLCFSSSSIRFT